MNGTPFADALPKAVETSQSVCGKSAFLLTRGDNSRTWIRCLEATVPSLIDDKQWPLFPRKAIAEYPPPGNSADCLGEVEADDGVRYHIKGDANCAPTRASEWVATMLAEEVGIAAPNPAVIELLDGQLGFGSRRISGVADDVATAAFLLSPAESNISSPVRGLSPLLSAIYAFDSFIYNYDRHLSNCLSIDDRGVRRLFIFDFSRSLYTNWPLSGALPRGCPTRRYGGILRNLHGFDLTVACATLDRIGGLKTEVVESFLRRMPAGWLPGDLRDSFMVWWEGVGRRRRLEELRKGLCDGSSL